MDISQTTDHESFRDRIRRERDVHFKKAERHSRHVKRLKVLLPIAAFAISLGLIATTVLRSMVPDQLSLDSTTIENGMIVMTNPGMSGMNSNGVPYSLKADRALLPVADPNGSDVNLEGVTASVPLGNDVTAVVNATTALYDRKNDKLEIAEPFTIKMSNGLTAKFQSASIDINKGTLTSDAPFSAEAPQASVVAHNVNITDNGNKINFGGGVHVVLSPKALRQAQQ